MKFKAPFITFEGGEGSGKSTQIKLLQTFLNQKRKDVVVTKEPGGTPLGIQLRHLLVEGSADKMDAKTEALLFFADRRTHLENKVWPALKKGQWVLSDRYADSTTAYQYYAYNRRLFKTDIERLYRFVAGSFKPDLTFILDIDPEIGLKRSFAKASQMDVKETRFESHVLSWHQKLREGYLQILKENPKRCVLLNADQTIEKLAEDIRNVIQERFF